MALNKKRAVKQASLNTGLPEKKIPHWTFKKPHKNNHEEWYLPLNLHNFSLQKNRAICVFFFYFDILQFLHIVHSTSTDFGDRTCTELIWLWFSDSIWWVPLAWRKKAPRSDVTITTLFNGYLLFLEVGKMRSWATIIHFPRCTTTPRHVCPLVSHTGGEGELPGCLTARNGFSRCVS